MNPPESSPGAPIDRALKVLMRHVYPALLRLAGIAVDPSVVRLEDTAINVAEHRADHVFPIGDESDADRWALYLEYQLQPDLRVLPEWFYKTAGLPFQLRRPVLLMAVYLTRGDRATFPDSYVIERDGLRNTFQFEVLRLWEFADRIRDGEFPELAPLLVLWEDHPDEETLRRERELILSLEVPRQVRSDLLGTAIAVGARFFTLGLLRGVFQEELEMLKEAEFIRELFAEEIAEKAAEARAEGRAELLRWQLERRFGSLPAEIAGRLAALDDEQCREVAERLVDARSLEDLGPLVATNADSEGAP